jgi:hypothetical protein
LCFLPNDWIDVSKYEIICGWDVTQDGLGRDLKKGSSKKKKKSSSCNLSSLIGKYELNYDFFSEAAGAFTFLDSKAYLTIEAIPPRTVGGIAGSGVLSVKYCFPGTRGFRSRQAYLVPTSLILEEDDGSSSTKSIDFHIGKNQVIAEVVEGYAFDGEYNCKDEVMGVAFYSFFDGKYYSATSYKDDDLPLSLATGCPI